MALAFDATSNASGAGVTSVTWSHTTSGANRALIVGVSNWNGSLQLVTGVTYAGTAMTNIGSVLSLSNDRAQQWKLSNPTTGANNVVVSFDAATDVTCGAVSFTGAHQTTASLTGTQATATGTSTAPSVNVSSTSGEIVIDTMAYFPTLTATVGAGQTQRWNVTTNEGGAGSTEGGAATVTMSWTLNASVDWALVGVGVKPAAVGTTVEPFSGLLLFKGYVPTTAKVKQPSPGKWLYVGQTPTLRTISVASPSTGKFILVGNVPAIKDIAFVTPTAGQILFKGYVPVAESKLHLPGRGLLNFVGQVPTVNSVKPAAPATATFMLVGQQPTITLFYWNCPDATSSTWAAVSATAATWSAVSASSTTWSTTATVSQSWSTVSSLSSTWSPL